MMMTEVLWGKKKVLERDRLCGRERWAHMEGRNKNTEGRSHGRQGNIRYDNKWRSKFHPKGV